ncbi:MAG: histidine phosphatase family protein, partial [Actinomycetes bacterium]
LLGHADPELDDLGASQAAALAAEVSSGRFGDVRRIISSPLQRTRGTAAAIAAAVGREVEIDQRFIELNYGEFDGVPLSEIPTATWSAWRSDVHFRPPGGESLADLAARVRPACAELLSADEPGGTTVVVSHVSPIKAAVAWTIGVDDSVSWRLHLDPASITAVTTRGAAVVLSVFNDTGHLRG